LSIDRLAALAQTQEQIHRRLLEMTPTVSSELSAAWHAAALATLEPKPPPGELKPEIFNAQFHVLVTCRDEEEQVELLKRFAGERLKCKALLG
jgi:hypothetical protein